MLKSRLILSFSLWHLPKRQFIQKEAWVIRNKVFPGIFVQSFNAVIANLKSLAACTAFASMKLAIIGSIVSRLTSYNQTAVFLAVNARPPFRIVNLLL